MRLICVSTGSKDGNTYLLQSADGKYIVLDLGAKYKDILKACDYQINDIRFALYTHNHKDHLKTTTVKELKKHGVYIFEKPRDGTKYSIWNVAFTPFTVPHSDNDGTRCPCKAYLIEVDGEKLLYMTDWMYCRYQLAQYNINHFLIAVNYTELDDDGHGGIHHVMEGHSSLQTALDFLKASVTDSCKSIICCHLSSRNCDEEKVLREIKAIVPETVNVAIAKKGVTFELL